MRNRRNIVWGVLLTAGLAALMVFAGCRAFVPEAVIVNKAPETYIIGSPLENGGGYYHFHVFWYGSDQDGQVERFVWALTDTTVQNLNTAEDEEDARFNPALDASHLDIGHWTTRTDTIFDFAINQGQATSYDMTFHLVAVDDFGDFDRTPARLYFFSNTLGSPTLQFFRVEGDEDNPVYMPIAQGQMDTVGFGGRYHLHWEGETPNIRGYDPESLPDIDDVPPNNDGLLGFKYQLTGALSGGCVPTLEDCWMPREFDESTNDSFSVFSSRRDLIFDNDGSDQTNPFKRLLDSGEVGVRVNSIDLAGVEVADYLRDFTFVVNYDPETILLDGQTDFAHPEDSEVYPYYILLNDPTQAHHAFTSGDRIPDRTYVVFKALARDDSRDARLSDYDIGLTGVVSGVRYNFTGGTFPFSSGNSDIDSEPTWGEGVDGWYADTLGFMTGPSTNFTFKMQAVDEHGRYDGSPASISFDVGYPPVLQCIEFLPDLNSPSGFGPDLEPYEGGTDHPCFDGGVTEFAIRGQGAVDIPGRTYLSTPPTSTYLAINRSTLHASFQTSVPDAEAYYSIQCNVYPMAILLHGRDDLREAWSNPRMRTMGWKYQVDYDCDPYNNVKDGGGMDDILASTWGYEQGGTGLSISDTDGLWKLTVNVMVPTQMVSLGSTNFFQIIRFTLAGGDEVLAQQLVDICTRQLSEGTVRAVALDQTQCGFFPSRPGKYHLFSQVRPPLAELPNGTWRDCVPNFGGIVSSMYLSKSTMASHDVGHEVEKRFRLVLQEAGGDYGCTPAGSSWQ
jgi:hypothetical protein